MENFSIEISTDEETNKFVFSIYDEEGEFESQIEAEDFHQGIRHTLHEASPILAAAAFPSDHLEWSEEHQISDKERKKRPYD
jgi:hypothetical protein